MSEKYDKIVEELKQEFPKFQIVDKEKSLFMKIIYYGTFMFLWNRRFISDYITVIFGKVYMQQKLFGTDSAYRILRHERVHMRDAKKYPVLFEISYIFLLPTVVTMRAFWEYRGYLETLRAVAEERKGKVYVSDISRVIWYFTNSSYLWMFPFRNFLMKKYKEALTKENIRIVED